MLRHTLTPDCIMLHAVMLHTSPHPQTSHPAHSTTWQYADNSNLKGYEATDIVQFGDFYTFTKFGGITTCNSPDFQRVNGILGFGLPQQMPVSHVAFG